MKQAKRKNFPAGRIGVSTVRKEQGSWGAKKQKTHHDDHKKKARRAAKEIFRKSLN